MTAGNLIAFNLALFAAIVSPGPALLMAIRTTLSGGRHAGVATGLGLGSMAAIWTLAALLGLEAVFGVFPWAYAAAKALGAAYLIYLAVRIWRSAGATFDSRTSAARSAFVRGVLINLLNPKAVLFAAAVLIVVFPPGMRAAEIAAVVGNHMFVEFVFYTALAFAINSRAVTTAYLRARKHLDRTASVVLGALAVRLLTSR